MQRRRKRDRIRRGRMARWTSLLLGLSAAALTANGQVHGHAAHKHQNSSGTAHTQARDPGRDEDYARTEARYRMPDTVLTDTTGAKVNVRAALAAEPRPVLLQFIYTSCPGVCPILTTTLAQTREELGSDRGKFALWSITIDPQHDTPRRLKAYAAEFDAGRDWRFFTGKLDDIESIQKAFKAFNDSKMDHRALTFIRSADRRRWIRLEGGVTPTELADEARRAAK